MQRAAGVMRPQHFEPVAPKKRTYAMIEDGSGSASAGASVDPILPRLPDPALVPRDVADGTVQGKLLRFTYQAPSEDPKKLLMSLPLQGSEQAFAARVGTEIHVVVQLGPSTARKLRKTLEAEYTHRGDASSSSGGVFAPVVSAYKGISVKGGLSKQYESIKGQELYAAGHVTRALI